MVKNPLSNAGYEGSIPGWGTEIPHATRNKAHAPQLEKARTTQQEAEHYKRGASSVQLEKATTVHLLSFSS